MPLKARAQAMAPGKITEPLNEIELSFEFRRETVQSGGLMALQGNPTPSSGLNQSRISFRYYPCRQSIEPPRRLAELQM
jgi:hypothetical protein